MRRVVGGPATRQLTADNRRRHRRKSSVEEVESLLSACQYLAEPVSECCRLISNELGIY